MVNTFLLDVDFRKSASRLDWRRLGKQRVEAYQILIVIQKYRFLADYFNIPNFPVGVDTPTQKRAEWVGQVMTAFKSANLGAILIRNNSVIQYPKGATLPRVPKSGNQLCYDCATKYVFETSGKRSKIVSFGQWQDYVQLEELHYVNMAQVSNNYLYPSFGSGKWSKIIQTPDLYIVPNMRTGPMVNLWLGFEEALKAYTNAHIEEWIRRGYKNLMKTYNLVPDSPRPAWTYSEDTINNFKSSLIEREIERHEEKWYMDMPDFIESWVHTSAHGQQFQQIVKQLPVKSWWSHVPANYLLQYGRFPGFIWP